MLEETLLLLGLTKSEIATYLALLDIGPSTTGPLIKHAKISSGKAYLILDKLGEKGLVTHTILSGTKQYQAKNPERLIDYINEKKELLEELEKKVREVMPQLKATFDEQKEKTTSEVFEGIKGFKTFHRFMLDEMKKGETIFVFGAPREANEKLGGYFVEWNEKRVKKGIKLKILYNADSREFGEKRKKLPLTEVRYMDEGEITPAWVDVFRNYVATINIHDKPICFLIKDELTRESYMKYFTRIWERASKK